MKDLEKLKAKIEQGQWIQLSSDLTRTGVILGIIISIVLAIILIPKMINTEEFQSGLLLAGFILLLFLLLTVYQLIYASEAELIGRKLKLKKIIGKKYVIDVGDIKKMSTLRTRTTKYTTVRFLNGEGKLDRALIMNSNSVIFGKDISVEDAITLAQSSQ